MPIYEYRCNACNCRIERLQKFSDPILTICPECGQNALEKLISPVGFQLKGSGWYATDFKGGCKQPSAKDSAEPPSTPCQGKPDGGCPCVANS